MIENEKMAQYKFASVATILSETFRRFLSLMPKLLTKSKIDEVVYFKKILNEY